MEEGGAVYVPRQRCCRFYGIGWEISAEVQAWEGSAKGRPLLVAEWVDDFRGPQSVLSTARPLGCRSLHLALLRPLRTTRPARRRAWPLTPALLAFLANGWVRALYGR
jgi:hypothetical protein